MVGQEEVQMKLSVSSIRRANSAHSPLPSILLTMGILCTPSHFKQPDSAINTTSQSWLSCHFGHSCDPPLTLHIQNHLPRHQISGVFLPPSPPSVSRPHRWGSYSTHSFTHSPNITSSRWSPTCKTSSFFLYAWQ